MAQIEWKKVTFSYPGCDTPALREISLTIRPSEFVVLCGRSGCGKSTFLRQMKKNLRPFGERCGQVLYCGKEIGELGARESAAEIGFVQQNPENQIVTDKVWHELAFGLESLGMKNSVIRLRVSEMASFFGIQTWFEKSVSDLSGGQKQLLNLASVMAMQPKVLILDEPTSQLDPIAATGFLETLRRINRELGTTVVISEHRLEELFPMADRVLVMEEGTLIAQGAPKDVANYLGEHKNAMFRGLPTPMKVFSEVRPEGNCPVTVREGRLWLSGLFPNGVEKERIVPVEPRAKASGKKEEPPYELQMEDVWFRYDRNGSDIVRGMNLGIRKGELFCMVGGNGVGKSTTLKLLAGIEKPYRGKVSVRGKERMKADHVTIGVLPQSPQALFTEITAEEELFEALYYDGTQSDEQKKKAVGEMFDLLQLSHLKKTHPYDLSGGEQQRLALGKILLLKPEILLLDEPTKGLDPSFKSVLGELLKGLKRYGLTVALVTHDIEFAAEHADRCAMVFDGDIVSCDEPRAFFGGNSFYTTAANRMSRHLFPDAVTCEDVIGLCEDNLTRKVI